MSELDRLKLFPSFLCRVAALSSSVVGGVIGRPIFGIRPSFGTLMLPLGFLFALTSRPAGFLTGVRGLGLGLGTGGAWIWVICFISVVRFGDWKEGCVRLYIRLVISLILKFTLVRFFFAGFLAGFLTGILASADGV